MILENEIQIVVSIWPHDVEGAPIPGYLLPKNKTYYCRAPVEVGSTIDNCLVNAIAKGVSESIKRKLTEELNEKD